MSKVLNFLWNVLLKVLLLGLVFFVVTFVIYFFNLDMKATALLEPFFAKHYDAMQRNQYI